MQQLRLVIVMGLVAALAGCASVDTRFDRDAATIEAAAQEVESLNGNYPTWFAALATRAAERGLDEQAHDLAAHALQQLGEQGPFVDHVESNLSSMIFYTCVRMARLDQHFTEIGQPTDYFAQCVVRANRYRAEEWNPEHGRDGLDGEALHYNLVDVALEYGLDDDARAIAQHAVEAILPTLEGDDAIYEATGWIPRLAATLGPTEADRECTRIYEALRLTAESEEEWYTALAYSDYDCFAALPASFQSEMTQWGRDVRDQITAGTFGDFHLDLYLLLLAWQIDTGATGPFSLALPADGHCGTRTFVNCLVDDLVGSAEVARRLQGPVNEYQLHWLGDLHWLALVGGSEADLARVDLFVREGIVRYIAEVREDPVYPFDMRDAEGWALDYLSWGWLEDDPSRLEAALLPYMPLRNDVDHDVFLSVATFSLVRRYIELGENDRAVHVLDTMVRWDPALERSRWGFGPEDDDDEENFVIPGWREGYATFYAARLYGRAGATQKACDVLWQVWFPGPWPGGMLAIAQAQTLFGCAEDATVVFDDINAYVATHSNVYFGFEDDDKPEDPIAVFRAWTAVSAIPPLDGAAALLPRYPYEHAGEFWYYGATVPY